MKQKLLFDHNKQQYVLRTEGEAFNRKNTSPTVQYGAGSIMPWGCSAVSWSAALMEVNWILTKDYCQILQQNLKSSAEDWVLGAIVDSNRTVITNTHQMW